MKYIPFASVNGFFARPGVTGTRVAAARHELKVGQKFTTGIGKEGEQMLFVLSGEIGVHGGGQDYTMAEKDTALITGPNEVTVRGGPSGAIMIEVQAPPYKGW